MHNNYARTLQVITQELLDKQVQTNQELLKKIQDLELEVKAREQAKEQKDSQVSKMEGLLQQTLNRMSKMEEAMQNQKPTPAADQSRHYDDEYEEEDDHTITTPGGHTVP